MIHTINNFYAVANNKRELDRAFNAIKGGDKLITGAIPGEFTGVLVTSLGKVIPARYNARVVYWLSAVEQHAFFVPRSHCVAHPALYGTPVTIWHDTKDGTTELVDNVMKLGYAIREQSITLDGMRQDPHALAYELQYAGGRWHASPSYNTPKAGVHIKSSTNAVLAASLVNFEENKMQDLNAILFGDELFEVKVTFKDNDVRQYTYKSVEEYQAGNAVVVDTPSNGLVVVNVVSCRRGLDINGANFPEYKWVVGKVDLAAYHARKSAEADFLAKAKREKARREAIAKLAELGVTAEEYKAAIFGTASKE